MTDAGVTAPIHKNWSTTLPRIDNFINSTRFQEVNLKGKLYPDVKPVTLSYWAMPGGEGAWEDWAFEDIISQAFESTAVAMTMQGLWYTWWFKVDYDIPVEWTGKEVRLRWDTDSEASVWNTQGELLQGLATGTDSQTRPDFIITDSFDGVSGIGTLYIEVAGNRVFGGSDGDDIDPPNPNKVFTLSRAEIATMDRAIYKLTRDLEVLHDIADEKSKDPIGHVALFTANQMVNNIIKGDYNSASQIADAYFTKGNGARVHTLAAIGNCHIDSAWLWPISETKRKVGRSYANQIGLIEKFPEFIFVASQAQQWDWCKQYYPSVFNKLKGYVQFGKFLPVGGTWVEMDGNIPSGESFIRQFFYGQKFYQTEFAYTCKEFWLPDTFGYSGHIPGLIKHMGLTRFLTQKLSWSLVNKFPHHNFIWEGIDGSTVLAHFPPGDNYGMTCMPSQALYTVNNLQDKGRVATSAFLYGHGDGGGGPTEDMLQRAERLKDVDGIPKLQMMTPDDMFTRLEGDVDNMCKWVGELFLELHNGTYTSQAAMKQLCRQTEFKLRDAEFLLSSAVGSLGLPASSDLLTQSQADLEVAWKKMLLNQFHDILPGSSIALVYVDATEYYNEAIASADAVFANSIDTLFGTSTPKDFVAMNTLQWPRREIISSPVKTAMKPRKSKLPGDYVLLDVPPLGYSTLQAVTPSSNVSVTESNGVFIMDNGIIYAEFSSLGQLISLKVAGDDRDIFRTEIGTQLGGNRLVIYDDEPLYWDAWDVMDYHLETVQLMNETGSGYVVTPATILEAGPLIGKISWGISISSASTLAQAVEIRADCPYLIFHTDAGWHENRKFIKVLFDTNIHTRNATFDIQFGHLQRATHMNTSWDTARYEVCGHKWADLSEPDWGIAVLNDSKYGWTARGSSLTLSLLRSPKAPDDTCDMRTHHFKYAVMPHVGSLQENELNRRAYEFNNPLRLTQIPSATTATDPTWSIGDVVGSGIILHTVKPADDNSGSLILRMFEGNGCKSTGTINLKLPVAAVYSSSGMEETGTVISTTSDNGVTHIPISLTPFQIFAIKVTF